MHSSNSFAGFHLSGTYRSNSPLNFQGIVYWPPAISHGPLATSLAHKVFTLILFSSAIYSATQPIVRISCFLLFNPTHLELPASMHSWIPVTSCF